MNHCASTIIPFTIYKIFSQFSEMSRVIRVPFFRDQETGSMRIRELPKEMEFLKHAHYGFNSTISRKWLSLLLSVPAPLSPAELCWVGSDHHQ